MSQDQEQGIEVPCRVIFEDDGTLTLTCRPPIHEEPAETAGEDE